MFFPLFFPSTIDITITCIIASYSLYKTWNQISRENSPHQGYFSNIGSGNVDDIEENSLLVDESSTKSQNIKDVYAKQKKELEKGEFKLKLIKKVAIFEMKTLNLEDLVAEMSRFNITKKEDGMMDCKDELISKKEKVREMLIEIKKLKEKLNKEKIEVENIKKIIFQIEDADDLRSNKEVKGNGKKVGEMSNDIEKKKKA